jgi:hypothetical protein
MKKIFAIMAILSLLMVPFTAMAATMSDADLAAVTGQSGVTIDIGTMQLAINIATVTWCDYDGDNLGLVSGSYTNGGYINVAFYPQPMHVGIDNLHMTIDVGSTGASSIVLGKPTGMNVSSTTSIILGITVGKVTVDAIIMDINLDNFNGSEWDYQTSSLDDMLLSDKTAGFNVAKFGAYGKAYSAGITPCLDTVNAYANGTSYSYTPIANGTANNLGVFGISGVQLQILTPLTIQISAH